jgi:hypothetical protein
MNRPEVNVVGNWKQMAVDFDKNILFSPQQGEEIKQEIHNFVGIQNTRDQCRNLEGVLQTWLDQQVSAGRLRWDPFGGECGEWVTTDLTDQERYDRVFG